MIQWAALIAEYPTLLNAHDVSKEFTDLGTVSPYASEAIFWNLNNYFVIGSNNLVRPKSNITRAECATVVLRLLQKSVLVDVRSKTT